MVVAGDASRLLLAASELPDLVRFLLPDLGEFVKNLVTKLPKSGHFYLARSVNDCDATFYYVLLIN